jgi:hypothetical protein
VTEQLAESGCGIIIDRICPAETSASSVHLLIAISAITFFSPFYAWDERHFLFRSIAFVLGFTCLSLKLHNRRTNRTYMMSVIGLWWLLSVWLFLPFRPYQTLNLGSVYIFLVIMFLLLHSTDKRAVLLQTERIGAWIGLGSFVVVLLLAVGIDLPCLILEQSFREHPGQYYCIYPGTVVLSSQVFPAPWGGALVRPSGIFAEPGHFGVFCGLLLAANGFSFRTARSKMILMGGISTFSASFFGILFAGFLAKLLLDTLYRSKDALNTYFKAIIILALLISAIMIIPRQFQNCEFVNRILWSRFADGCSIQDVLETRAQEEFNVFFDEYRGSGQSLVGMGEEFQEHILGTRTSDWRGKVTNYGWPFIILNFLMYLFMFITSHTSREVKISVLVVLLIVAFHRASYVNNFLFIAVVSASLSSDATAVNIRSGAKQA